MKISALFILVFIASLSLFSQTDTLSGQILDKVVVKSYRLGDVTVKLPNVHGMYIIGGRKNEVLTIQELPANLAEKTGRQLFAKVPGAFIYDMDGSGNQINVATRGLDAHRSWEFNVRQNGVMINSDIYGYPASHYSMPMEAIRNIEIIRGTASLQYGAEFGGMINYVTKQADTTRLFSFENITSVGSYGLFSSFNAVGGKTGRFTYYGYYHQRVSDGYRDHANSKSEAQFLHTSYQLSDKVNIRLELGRSRYLYRIPGPLTDSMFLENPRQSTRSRNYFEPDIYVPSLTLEYAMSPKTRLQWVASGVFGNRNSVEFEGFADKADVIDPETLAYKPRTVNIDRFNSKNTEIRLLHQYQTGRIHHTVSMSLTYFNNLMHRRQQGKGTTGTDYDLTITGEWGRDLTYHSQSVSYAVENMISISKAFTVTPGFRYEYGQTDMEGRIAYLDPQDIPNRIRHRIPVFGINASYQAGPDTRLYGGISQAYRPVLFKDIIPASTLERANKNLKDASGYNAEIGISGKVKSWMKYDITAFTLSYNNRLGNLVLEDDSISYIFKTNIGDSQTDGIEMFTELIPFQSNLLYISLFTSTSWMKGRYKNTSLASGGQNIDISGNRIESVPAWISRNGLNIGYRTWRMSLLFSYVDKTYSDPANVEIPTPNGSKGLVPAYGIWDLNMSWRVSGSVVLRGGINNLTNLQYFTKRPLFYPGPGVWSSDGRSIVFSLGMKL
jgi:Fe(3+) dicitrate transport protein